MQKISLLSAVMSIYGIPRQEATGLIMSARVLVNDKPITKVGTPISIEVFDNQNILRIKNYDKYVSRGAYKLLGALDDFQVNVEGLTCLDIGSSTGGFTDVLLQNGAKHVYAVDCGSNQLDYRLRSDSRVTVYEQTSIQNVTPQMLGECVDLAVMDVSFTSCIGIVKYIFETNLAPQMITLIKPQFEYEHLKNELGLSGDFHGIVNSDDERKKILDYVTEQIASITGIEIAGLSTSKIKGTKGNEEYLIYVKKM